MKLKLSFQRKLLTFILLMATFSILLVVIYNVNYLSKRDHINDMITRINTLNNYLILDIKSQSDFMRFDAIDTVFFLTGTSHNLETHKLLSEEVKEMLASLAVDKDVRKLNIKSDLDSLSILINKINDEFLKIILDIKLRGFKDFGVEGEMRKYAHMLEASDINPTLVLSLRRHEKDYIIRKEQQYIEKLNYLGKEFRNYINSIPNRKATFKDSITDILDNYMLEFNNLVKLESEIGLNNKPGLRQNLEKLFISSETIIGIIIDKANTSKTLLYTKLELNAVWFFIVLYLVIILLSIYLSKYITNPLKVLTKYISNVPANDFNLHELPDIRNSDNEIAILFSEFRNMLRQLQTRESERAQAEAALRENEIKYRNLADLLPQSIFETDSDCSLTYFNKTMGDSFGFDNSVFNSNYRITDLLNTDSETLLGSDNASGVDYLAYKKNGEEVPILLYVSKILKNGSFNGLRGIMVDITEKKRYMEELKEQKQRAEQADKLKSAFLSNMSHEIRTPLNSIVGFSQILTQPDLDNETKLEYAGYINNSSDLLLKIINDILDIAKIESGQFKITYSVFNLNLLMNKLLKQSDEMKKIRKKEYIQIRVSKFFDDQLFFINSDPHRLEQVIINLLSNAIKFTSSGLIEIGYRIVENDKVEFFVKDTGLGIPADKIDLIFERFIQIEDLNNKQYEGTGLGLSISKSIIELLGGRMWVESVLGQGSVFYFEIPISTSYSLKYEEPVLPKHKIDLTCMKGVKLLIAEDVDYNFLFLREGLKSLGMEILRANNGYEAVKIFIDNPETPVVLMDMRMPVMDGYEASGRIKIINPAVKIIATTAYAMAGEKEKCLDAGCDYYLSKPIRISLLIEKISEYTIAKSFREASEATEKV